MTLQTRTKGQLEADVTAAFTRFEREHLGRGPREARAFLIQDMLLIRLKGVLTPAETVLAIEPGGVEAIKQIRSRLIESSRGLIEELVREKTGVAMVSMHTDLSVRSGERIFVITLEMNLEEMLKP